VGEAGKAKGTMKEGFLCGNPATAPFKDLEDFYSRGQLVHLEEFTVWEQDAFTTRVLVPVKPPDYARASVEDAFNVLAVLPDPDFIGKLFLVDHLHPMAPWLQQTQGTPVLAECSEDGTVILYRPTSAGIQSALTYEWCNLLRTLNPDYWELFTFTQFLEDYVDLETGKKVEEQMVAWSLLGCLLLREPEKTVFAACVRFPLKSAVFGRAVLKVVLEVSDFRQTAKYRHFLEKAKFIDFSASKVALDALKKLPERNSEIEKLIAFLSQQSLLKSMQD
jgi:hypothetical protein